MDCFATLAMTVIGFAEINKLRGGALSGVEMSEATKQLVYLAVRQSRRLSVVKQFVLIRGALS